MTPTVTTLKSAKKTGQLMAKNSWTDGQRDKEATPKKTSIGNGRRKQGSYRWSGQKKYRGQGK